MVSAEEKKLMAHFRNVADTESGRVVLRYIALTCGHDVSSAVWDRISGGLDSNGTNYNEGRRSIYLNLRRLLPRTVLAEIELPPEDETLDGEIEDVS